MTDNSNSVYPTRDELDELKDKINRGETVNAEDLQSFIRYLDLLIERVDQLDRQRSARGEISERRDFAGGRMPFGFFWSEDSQRWLPDKNYDIYMLMVDLRNQDKGYHAIAAELNRLGLATPKGARKWWGGSVERILKNPFYRRTKLGFTEV